MRQSGKRGKMLKIERQNIISQQLSTQGFVLVPEMSSLLRCSEETVRRDLKEMEREGKLVRTHGGAYQAEKYDKTYPMELRKVQNHRTKEKFAEHALDYIKDNDMIMLDSSSTCLALAEAIVAHSMSITLITNSFAICRLCHENNTEINLICVGGAYRKRTSAFADPNTVDALKSYHADKSFISCPNLTIEFGLSDNHISEANVRKQMIIQSEKRFLLVDHEKFDVSANIPFDGLEKIDYLFTNQRLSPEWKKYAADHDITIEYIDG